VTNPLPPPVQGLDLKEELRDTYGFTLDSYARNVAILFGWGFLVRVLAVLTMSLANRDKKI
jgi:hypothetical protein